MHFGPAYHRSDDVSFSVHHIRKHMISICPIIDDVKIHIFLNHSPYHVTHLPSCPGSSLRVRQGLICVYILPPPHPALAMYSVCAVFPFLTQSLLVMPSHGLSLWWHGQGPANLFPPSLILQRRTQFREHLFHVRPWSRCWGIRG